jgi:hypothetical protein
MLSPVVVAASVDERTVAMEKQRLERKLESLKKRCSSSSNSGFPGYDWCNRGPDDFRSKIDELERDPEFYFYNKKENSNEGQHGTVIDKKCFGPA